MPIHVPVIDECALMYAWLYLIAESVYNYVHTYITSAWMIIVRTAYII